MRGPGTANHSGLGGGRWRKPGMCAFTIRTLQLRFRTYRSLSRSLHPGGNPGATLESISHSCHPILVAFVWELTRETIVLPLGCLQGGLSLQSPHSPNACSNPAILFPNIDSCITQRKAQGPSRTCNESKCYSRPRRPVRHTIEVSSLPTRRLGS